MCDGSFIKSVGKHLGLLQDASLEVEDGDEGGHEDEPAAADNAEEAVATEAALPKLASPERGRRERNVARTTRHHRLTGGMDVVKNSNPFLADVIQVRL